MRLAAQILVQAVQVGRSSLIRRMRATAIVGVLLQPVLEVGVAALQEAAQ